MSVATKIKSKNFLIKVRHIIPLERKFQAEMNWERVICRRRQLIPYTTHISNCHIFCKKIHCSPNFSYSFRCRIYRTFSRKGGRGRYSKTPPPYFNRWNFLKLVNIFSTFEYFQHVFFRIRSIIMPFPQISTWSEPRINLRIFSNLGKTSASIFLFNIVINFAYLIILNFGPL